MNRLQDMGSRSSFEDFSFRIAGLFLKIVLPKSCILKKLLPSFEPFLQEKGTEEEYACVIEVRSGNQATILETGKLLSDVSVVWGDRFRFYECGQEYLTTVEGDHSEMHWSMNSNQEFSYSVISMPEDKAADVSVLSWLIMVAFGQASLLHQTLLIHASAVVWQGKGFAFLGKSGTGKSTHSKLWLNHMEGAELLNDDNPAIRLEANGEVYIYGTPWSGKTPCYKNKKAPLTALVRLEQAKRNVFSLKIGVEALVDVLPSCTAIRWNKQLFNEMANTVGILVENVQVAKLDCLPNKEAALLCNAELMKRIKINNPIT